MEYKKYTISELCNTVTDYVANGSFKSLADNVKYKNEEGYARVIRLVDFNNKYSKKDSIWVDKYGYEYLKKSKLFGGEIIITNVGANLGTVFITPKLNNPMTLGPNAIMLKTNQNDLYLYYWLISPIGKNKIKSIVTGSAMPKFNKTDLRNIELLVPNIDVQNKIVKILNNLDEKIELNNQINDNLLEIIKNTYRNKYYMKAGNRKSLSVLIKETISGDWGKENQEGNYIKKVYCIRGADIPQMMYGSKGKTPTRYILEKNYNNKKLLPNEIIIEISGGSPSQSTGRSAFITEELIERFDNPIICTNFCKAIEFIDKKYAPYVYVHLLNLYDDNVFFNYENGTTGIKNLALTDMLNKEYIYIPSDKELINFCNLFYSLFNKITENSAENQNLEQLRDTLLPKLMNGEIDLDKVEI